MNVDAVRRDGYCICNDVLTGDQVERLRKSLAEIPEREEVRRRGGVSGVRNLLEICPTVCELAVSPEIRRLVTPVLGDGAFAVRAIYFDKSPDVNWSLSWHQDGVISVAERRDLEGFAGWSQKAGVWQVRPPAEVLARMVAVRVHLDDSDTGSGPLRILPGSHRHGWIDDIDQWKRGVPEVICTVRQGGVLAMFPLALHASAASQSNANRRVIHIEYAADELPGGLRWNNRVGAGRL